MGEHFVCLADCTSGNEFLNITGEAGPLIVLRKKYNCLQVASMPPFKGAMGSAD